MIFPSDTYSHTHADGTQWIHPLDHRCRNADWDLAKDGMIHPMTETKNRPMRLHGLVHQHTSEDRIGPCCLEPTEKVERVVWTDSGMFIDEGWAKTSVYRSHAEKWHGDVVTIGTPMYEDDNVLVIGLSHDRQTDNWFGAQLIAKVCIKERTAL